MLAEYRNSVKAKIWRVGRRNPVRLWRLIRYQERIGA